MREINNNQINNLNFKGIQKTPAEISMPAEQTVSPEMKEISDLSKAPSVTFGKSQITNDSIERDLTFFEKNPKVVEELNSAIDKYSQTHTEAETLKMIEKLHQEFVAK